jgi:DNA-binding response OmpR family regulator
MFLRHKTPEQISRIIIADADPVLRKALRSCLQEQGYLVDEVSDGWDLLEQIQIPPVTAIIVDCWLLSPGDSVVDDLLQADPGLAPRLLVMTSPQRRRQAREQAGHDIAALLVKPIPQKLLLLLLHQLAGSAGGQLTPSPFFYAGYGATLEKVRHDLRGGAFAEAEELLMRAGSIAGNDPEFLNLVGVVHETRGRLRLARTFYGRAITARHDYFPAQQNMRRLFELQQFGQSNRLLALGDEPPGTFDSASCNSRPVYLLSRFRLVFSRFFRFMHFRSQTPAH